MRRDTSALQAELARLEADNAQLLHQVAGHVATQRSLEEQRRTLSAELAETHERATRAEQERDHLRRSYERLKEELELLRRRMVVATAERVDTAQLELEFAAKMQELEEVAGTLGLGKRDDKKDGEKRRKPTGRRKLSELRLPVERIELTDPSHEALAEEGKATRHGFETSYRLAYQRGGYRILELRRAKYRMADQESGETRVRTTRKPKELLESTIFAPSLAADILYKKSSLGLPFYRQERDMKMLALPVDRATMSRVMATLGELFGDTVIRAMRQDAMANAFCVATDATGLKVQPPPRPDGKRQPCKRGHVLVLISDRDHVFFDYLPNETSAAIAASFEGFRCYVQADAKSVFDILYRAGPDDPDADPPCQEVGCWAHMRRKFWEATVGERSELAREGLVRIGRIYELDESWKDLPSRERQRRRDAHLRAHVDDFFAWCEEQRAGAPPRGWLASAFGYAHRQKDALRRFLDDGRLQLDNNRSERALRQIAIGRKNWLFAGSDEHAESLTHVFSLEASARLHGLDVAGYFRDLIRVLPYWPRDRFLELSPRDWAQTRARLDQKELEPELGHISVPDPL